MRNRLNVFLMMLVTLALAACGHNPSKPEKEIVYTTKVVYLTPPPAMLERVSIEAPPDKAAFLAMTDKQRVDVLTDKYILQTKQVAQCNRSLEGIEVWIDKQLKLQKEQEAKK